VAVDAEPHEVTGAEQRLGGQGRLLGHVADVPGGLPGRTAEDRQLAGGQRLSAEQGPDEAGLAGSVRAQHGKELSCVHV
jgi:hypothetical protein